MKNGLMRRGPFSASSERGLLDALQPADAGADQHAGGDLVLVAVGMPAGVVERLLGRRERVDDEVVDLALILGLHPLVGIKGALGTVAARHGAGDLTAQIRGRRIR